MVDWMEKLWGSVKTDDIYKSWPGGALLSMPWRNSMFDTTPGIEFFTKLT